MGDPFAHYKELPFFEGSHADLCHRVAAWAEEVLGKFPHGHPASEAACREMVRSLGQAGWLAYTVGGKAYGGVEEGIGVRAVCLIREVLAYHSGLAEFAFAMQGLGSGPITLYGTPEQKRRYLPRVAAGEAVAAFALSEPGAGSDAAALTCRAYLDGEAFVLEGEKAWVSNGGIADFYVVFARLEPGAGGQGISAFLVDAGTEGLAVEQVEVVAPHPLAKLVFRGCRIPRSKLLGSPGQGLRIAMETLDIFRVTVAAAALGFAKRALNEALQYALDRKMFGTTLARMQATRTKLGDIATELEASALLTYRAAWLKDRGHRATREVAMAKLYATERAQAIVDAAVQLMGGEGVRKGGVLEALYREIRPLRIYEGASEVQRLIVAREILRERGEEVGVR